jgi:FKBP-type peptidyl-prolyl cis-trans isomerase
MKTIISLIVLIAAAVGIYFISKSGPVKTAEPSMQTIENVAGLKITILKESAGQAAKSGDTIAVNYTGKFENGEAFDSNVDPKFNHVKPFIFVLGQGMVIKGWDLGVAGMKIGERRKLVISPELGYGASAAGPIPANSTLTFEVELLAIKQ